jgi:hypothetical protein
MIAYPLAILTMYLIYLPWDTWFYLRFLLPAFPAVCVGLAAVFTSVVHNSRVKTVAIAIIVVITTSMTVTQWKFVAEAGLFQEAPGERRFARAAEFASTLPSNAILISDAYSGTLHFYTGRDVFRWVLMTPDQFDRAFRSLKEQGYPLSFIVDPGEERSFTAYSQRTAAAEPFARGRVPDSGEVFVVSDLSSR